MAEARKWKVGNPSDPTVSVGALISKEHLEKVMMLRSACDLTSFSRGLQKVISEVYGKDHVLSKVSYQG